MDILFIQLKKESNLIGKYGKNILKIIGLVLIVTFLMTITVPLLSTLILTEKFSLAFLVFGLSGLLLLFVLYKIIKEYIKAYEQRNDHVEMLSNTEYKKLIIKLMVSGLMISLITLIFSILYSIPVIGTLLNILVLAITYTIYATIISAGLKKQSVRTYFKANYLKNIKSVILMLIINIFIGFIISVILIALLSVSILINAFIALLMGVLTVGIYLFIQLTITYNLIDKM